MLNGISPFFRCLYDDRFRFHFHLEMYLLLFDKVLDNIV